MGNRHGTGVARTTTEQPNILLQGLSSSGKTTLLYRLQRGEVVPTMHTIDTNREELTFKGIAVVCWDVGGREAIRVIIRMYYGLASGHVFVVDSADHEQLDAAFELLIQYLLIDKATKGTVVMVLANKQDLPGALKCEEIERKFWQTYKATPDHRIIFRPCSVLTGEGLFEAFEDLVTEIKQNEERVRRPRVKGKGGKTTERKAENAVKSFLKRPFSCLKSLLLY